jgi:hypothetical protein
VAIPGVFGQSEFAGIPTCGEPDAVEVARPVRETDRGDGLIVNQKLVARIMRDLEIHGLLKRKRVTRNLANLATHDDQLSPA